MRTLNLGCGIRPLVDAVNHDHVRHHDYVDVAHDLEAFPWPWADRGFDRIVADDVLEHLAAEVRDWLGECWRLLEVDGRLELRVPHWGTGNAYANPTHRRSFDLRTFDFWDPSMTWHSEYGRHDPTLAACGRLWNIERATRVGDNCEFTLRKLPRGGSDGE